MAYKKVKTIKVLILILVITCEIEYLKLDNRKQLQKSINSTFKYKFVYLIQGLKLLSLKTY